MYSKFSKKLSSIIIAIVIVMIFVSCGSINYFTRMKKTPREYSINYCGDTNIKAPKSELNKKLWVVFSDRANNPTYINPGGKVKLKTIEFLEPFVVIKEKGDYLCLVKYDPEVVDPNLLKTKFKDRKKAEYYGWVNKANLLLTRQSVTDISTDFKNKQLSIISDTTSLNDPSLFFTKDSIRIFKDIALTNENCKIPFYEVVYTLKTSPDRLKSLISKKTEISPDSVNTEVLGWVHSSLISDIGQRLHLSASEFTKEDFLFRSKDNTDTLAISDYIIDNSKDIADRKNSLRYSPIHSRDELFSLVKLKTSIPAPVLDQRDNYVFNVNGNKISHSNFKVLEKDLKRINLMFVFEGKEQIIQNFPALVNVVQNLQPMFEEDQEGYDFNFGSVIALQGRGVTNRPLIKQKDLTPDYTDLMSYLVSETENVEKYRPLPTEQTWSGVRAAVDLFRDRKDETNLLVIMGEAGYSEGVDTLFLNKMTDYNCRVLGFQMQGETNNANNNFVLQIENMINYYAHKNLKIKREKIVFADQLKDRNRYRESSKNVYALDFPDRSMSQGWVLFPEKDAVLPMDMLTNSIDSLIGEIKWDNSNLINSLYKAFGSVGNHHHRYDSLYTNYFKPTLKFNRKLPTYFSETPVWYLPAEEALISDSLDAQLKYHLLLSKDELEGLNTFVDLLSAYEVDYKYKGKKQKTKKLCNCPDDINIFEGEVKQTSSGEPEYMSTKKIRKKLQNLYFDELRTCKLCKINKSLIKEYSLADAQRRITGCPTYNPILEKYTIEDLKKRNVLTDKELDELITYFKQKKEALDKYMHNADKFESNGQTYYWINQKLLP